MIGHLAGASKVRIGLEATPVTCGQSAELIEMLPPIKITHDISVTVMASTGSHATTNPYHTDLVSWSPCCQRDCGSCHPAWRYVESNWRSGGMEWVSRPRRFPGRRDHLR